MNDGWSPVHHEIVDEEPVSPARAEKETKAALKEDTDHGPALMLTIPPNMIAGLWSLSEALKANTEKVEEFRASLQENTDVIRAMADAVTSLVDDMRGSQGEHKGALTEVAATLDRQTQSQAEQMKTLAGGHESLMTNMKQWTETLDQAIRAPRMVSLNRDKDGKAVSATATVQ
jgi:hypothetical protein